MTQSQIGGVTLTLINRRHAGAARPDVASADHNRDLLRGTGEHRLDSSVAPVAHPALQAMFTCRVFGPGTEPHTLHHAANDDMTNALRPAHPNSPTSLVRAPRHPEG